MAGIIQEGGPWSGKRMAAGEDAVTGSKTDIDTGLATVEQVIATIKSTATGTDFHEVTVDFAGTTGIIKLYVWKPGSTSDTTLEASGAPIPVDWIAVGT